MIPEQIVSLTNIDELANLPAGQSNLYIIIGQSSYFLVFKDIPLGFKWDLVELADLFHFFQKVL
jgi:hypothetical protein